MDLELYLQEEPKLYKKYEDIKRACEELWSDVKLPWFTDHSPTHSARLISYLNQILAPVDGTPHALKIQECFIILASCYLHDIGMQDLRRDGKHADSLTIEDYDYIRKHHSERSYEMIREGVLRPEGTRSVDLNIEDEADWSLPLMRVCKAHATPYFTEMVQEFTADPVDIQNTPIHGEFLCALLMMADELDLTRERVNFKDTRLFTLSPDSEVHWYTHRYIEKARVENQEIIIRFRLPEEVFPHASLFQDRVKCKLEKQLALCNPIFKEATRNLVQLSVPDPVSVIHPVGIKEKISPEALDILLKESGKRINDELPSLNDFTPPVPSPLFTGREEERRILADIISSDSASRVSMIVGIGGTGKTELVAKCVSEQKLYPPANVLWFDISQQHTADDIAIALGYSEMLKSDKMPSTQKGVYISRAIEESGVLIIIDNAHEIHDPALDAMIEHAVSHLHNSRILLIGKSRTPLINRLEPKLLTRDIGGLADKGSEYAHKLKEQISVTIADDQLNSMCADLDNHPLAIEVALRILRYGVSPDDLAVKIVQFADKGGAGEGLSKRLLSELHSCADDSQRDLAYRLSVFRKPFPRKAVDYLAGCAEWETHLNTLIDRLMLRPDGGLFTMHPLVSIFCYEELQDKLSAHAGAANYLKSCRGKRADVVLEAEIIHHLLRSGIIKEATDILAEYGEDFLLWGHTAALQSMLSDIEKYTVLTDQLLLLRGRYYELLGLYEQANEDFTSCEICKDDDIRAEAICRKGYLQITWGNIKEAKQLFKQSRDIAESITSDRICAYVANGTASVAEIEGILSDALFLHQKSLNFLRNLPNAKDSDVAVAIGRIGSVLHAQGKYVEALDKHEASLKISKEIGDRNGIAMSLGCIGSVLHAQGKYAEALDKYEASLKISKEIGDRNGIAASLNNIGNVLHSQGKYAEALDKYEASLKISEEIGDRNGIAASLNNIGNVLHAQGKYAEALDKHEASLKISEEIGDRRGIAASLNNIGRVLRIQGKYDEALEKHEASLKIKKEIGDRQGIAVSLGDIGICLFAQKKYRQALQKQNEALCLKKEIGNIREVAITLGNIGAIYQKQGQYEIAFEYEKQAIELCRKIESWADLANYLCNNAYTTHHSGDLRSTVSYLLEADALYRWLKHENRMRDVEKQILRLRKDIGYKTFRNYAQEAFTNLPDHIQSYSGYEEYVEDTTIHRSGPKVGRNDPCPCGSGKKYKKCCENKDI